MLALSATILWLAGLGLAQNTNSGEIRGTVSDPSGASIPGAKVTVLNIDTGVSLDYYTNAAGLYDTVSILPGRYRITVSKEGFSTLVRDGITLEVGSPLLVDARLNIGTSTEQVQVAAEAPLIKTETAEQSANLEAEQMTELPNVTRSWVNFNKMLPGVTQAGTDGAVAVNGTMPAYASYLADGASATLSHSTNPVTSNFEATAEVQIISSTFSAQYGTGAVVYNQISKSGTNQWHGSAYEFVQNNDLNARSFFSPSVPISHFNDFGGAVGGPIRKDKMFFYFNTEKIFNRGVNYPYYTYPTTDILAGNFSNPIFPTIYDPTTALPSGSRTPFPGNVIPADRKDPLALAVQKYFPTPNLPGYTNNLLYTQPTNSPSLHYFGRVDYNISSRNRLTGSVHEFDTPGISNTPDFPIDGYTGHGYEVSSQISDVFAITPTAVNEFRIGFTRQFIEEDAGTLGLNYPQKLGWTYAKENLFPSVTIGGPVGGTSLGANIVSAIYAQLVYDASDTVTLIRGRHVLHFGAEVLYLQDNDTSWNNKNPGAFSFTGAYTASAPFGTGGLGYADFLLGQVATWSANNSPIKGMREMQPQMFIQDDFKLKPNVTVNFGLRYQIQGGWHAKGNELGSFDPKLLNPVTNTLGAAWFAPSNGRNSIEAPVRDIVLPRVGVAWNLKRKWVIRGGFGVYTYPWSEDTYTIGAGFGSSSSGSLSDSTKASPLFAFSATNPPLNYVAASKAPGAYNGQNISFANYHTPVAHNYQWSLSVQRQLPGGMVAEAAYVGNHVNGLSFPADANQVPYNKLGTSSTPQSLRPYPQFLNINGNLFNAISNYDSLQASLEKRFSAGVSFNVNYTWSKMLSEQDSSGWGGHAGNQYYQSAYNTGINYGLANVNRAHMFKGNVIYEIPIGKGKRVLNSGGPADWVVGGWQLSTIFIVETGQPYSPIMGNQNLSGALSGNWYSNVVGDPGLSNPTISHYFNTAAFAQPAAFTFGNAGRNILVGPRMSDIDFMMAKSFTIPKLERGRLQLRIDAINVINHPSFSNPNASIGTTSAGIITSTTVGGRVVQLGARLSF
jgi:hypothetical protein